MRETFGSFFLAMFVFIVVAAKQQFASIGREDATYIVVVWALVVLGAFAYQAYRGIISITFDGEVLTLRSLFRSQRASVREIVSVETSWWDLNRFRPVIRTRDRSFPLLGPFDGFHDFLSTMREANPGITIKRL